MREQAVITLNTWVEQTGLKEVIDGEMFVDALKNGSPFLKAEVFSWLTTNLPDGLFYLVYFLCLLEINSKLL